MASVNYGSRMGDRKEGRQLRSVPALYRLSPYLMRRRSDALGSFADTMEVTEIEQWLLAKRAEGWKTMNLMHLLIAAYVRTVAMRPGINRFVAGRRIYARNDISVAMLVRRSSTDAPTAIKVSFGATDTVYDVYRRLNEAVDEVLAQTHANDTEKLAASLVRLPRFLLRWVMAFARWMDYRDWLPRSVLDASPFHASLWLGDQGSLGIQPLTVSLRDFGTLPCHFSYGAKRRVMELSGDGAAVERRYVDYRIVCDGRIADTGYLAGALKCFKYLLKTPQLLELPPERVEDDIN